MPPVRARGARSTHSSRRAGRVRVACSTRARLRGRSVAVGPPPRGGAVAAAGSSSPSAGWEEAVSGSAGGSVAEGSARATSSEPMQESFGEGYDVKNVRRNPPPDLPSIMLHNRIVFLGEELTFDVVELITAELLYLESIDDRKPAHMYISSTGTMRPDGELVALETNGTMVYDVMNYVRHDVYTYNVGVAAGAACMLLAAGKKGRRYSYPNATALLQQPRTISTGQLQAIELDIRWRQMEGQMNTYYEILSKHTGNSMEKLKHDLKRPLYMSPLDAMEYGVIDHIFKPGGGTEDVEKMKALVEEGKRDRKEKLRTVDYNAKYDKYKNLK